MILPLHGQSPDIAASAFIAPDAWVIGDVAIAEEVSIFFGAVLRGDILPIRVGARTNIQEHSMLHTSHGRVPTIVGEEVTIGHRAIIHGCTIEPRTLIGMGAIVLDEAVIGSECLVAAGSVITEGKRFPSRSMIMGIPGKVVRSLTDEEVRKLHQSAASYVKSGQSLKGVLG